MKHLLSILLISSICLTQELEVDGNLKVTGTIQNDSLAQVIANLQAQITALQNQVIQLECINNGVIPEGYCDCNWNVLDICGDCGGDIDIYEDCFLRDPDGNSYEIVHINNQTWMAENLNYNYDTSSCYDDIEDNCDIHGRLYNYDNAQSICSELTGFGQWRLPSDNDWKELEMFLGMTQETTDLTGARGTDEGGKLKSLDLWQSPNLGATDEFNYNALPGGFKNFYGGGYYDQFQNVHFWLSDEGMARKLAYDNSQIDRMLDKNPSYRFSVRCIKD